MIQNINRTMLVLVFVAITYNALAFGGVRLIDQVISMAIVGLALSLLVFRTAVTKRETTGGGLAGLFALLFLAYACVRDGFAETEYASRREVIDVALAVIVLFVIANVDLRMRDWRWFVLGLLVVGAGLSMYAGYQYVAKSDGVWTSLRPLQYQGRGSGTYINPNHLAGFLAMVLPLGLAVIVASGLSWTLRIVMGYCVLVILGGIGFTLSRGGWVAASFGLVVAIAAVICVRRRNSVWAFLVVVALVIGGMVISSSFRLRSRANLTEREVQAWKNSTRGLIWKAAWNDWRSSPWWGTGANSFQYRYFAYRDVWLQSDPVRAHNDYLNTLCDYGAVGAALGGTFVFCLIGSGIRWFLRRAKDRNDEPRGGSDRMLMMAGALGGLIAIAVHSVVDFNLHIRANLLTAALLGGMTLALRADFERRGASVRTQRWVVLARRWMAISIAVILVAGLAWQFERAAREFYWLRLAQKAGWGNRGVEPALKAALGIEPGNPDTLIELGELYRQQSMLGEEDYRELAQQALVWYGKAQRIMSANPIPPMLCGMCFDWLGKHEEAGACFERMIKLDPNGKHVRAMMGWHYFQMEKYAESRKWIQRALQMPHAPDSVAVSYDKYLKEHGF